MKLFILANPQAGSKRAQALIQEICDTYPQLAPTIFLTRGVDDEYRQIQAILAEFEPVQDALLILGGDGTLSKALTALPKNIPFAYFPTGSGNDFARTLAIKDIRQVMEALIEKRTTPITVLQSNFGVVVNSLDLGFAAQVIAYSERSRTKRWLKTVGLGKIAYLLFGLRSLFGQSALSVQVELDGERMHLDRLFFLSLANNPYFGGGIMIWPDASPFQSQLHLVWFATGSLFYRIKALLEMIFHRHKSSKIIHHREAKEVIVTTDKDLSIQIDGEVVEASEIVLTCQERRIYR
ncbi:diacylglycerol/lipid kinase family protein [Streptococcus suis]|uniref:diacylglycerol/lipid kinase family protein n=1 Tax=Streptococcus suis TaxID=1307 RepID=UPI001ABEE83A|nr:NAD(+)/NADH kinase [Streptococcus suis]